jgi:hypothetical protein
VLAGSHLIVPALLALAAVIVTVVKKRSKRVAEPSPV